MAQRILSVAKKGCFVLDDEMVRDQVVAEHHDELFAGHFSVKKTLQKLKLYFYWPSMSSSVLRSVSHVLPVQQCKAREKTEPCIA